MGLIEQCRTVFPDDPRDVGPPARLREQEKEGANNALDGPGQLGGVAGVEHHRQGDEAHADEGLEDLVDLLELLATVLTGLTLGLPLEDGLAVGGVDAVGDVVGGIHRYSQKLEDGLTLILYIIMPIKSIYA